MRPRARTALGLGLALLILAATPALATFPFPATSGDVYDYSRLSITNGSCVPRSARGTVRSGAASPTTSTA